MVLLLLLTVRAWSSAFFASVFVRFVWRGEPLFAEETLCGGKTPLLGHLVGASW